MARKKTSVINELCYSRRLKHRRFHKGGNGFLVIKIEWNFNERPISPNKIKRLNGERGVDVTTGFMVVFKGQVLVFRMIIFVINRSFAIMFRKEIEKGIAVDFLMIGRVLH